MTSYLSMFVIILALYHGMQKQKSAGSKVIYSIVYPVHVVTSLYPHLLYISLSTISPFSVLVSSLCM